MPEGYRRSSYCGNSSCVEVDTSGDVVLVRDTKTQGWADGLRLIFTRDEWRAFVAGVKAGEFDV